MAVYEELMNEGKAAEGGGKEAESQSPAPAARVESKNAGQASKSVTPPQRQRNEPEAG